MRRRCSWLAIIGAALATSGCATPFYMGQQPTTQYGRAGDSMPEHLRTSIHTVKVEAGSVAPELYVGGDYGAPTDTVGEGAGKGAKAGLGVTGEMISEDPRALILVPIILPVAVIAGSIAGAAAAKIQEQIREFRDELTDDMVGSSDPLLPNSQLAAELETFLQSVDDIELAENAAATLTITLIQVGIMVDGNEAEIYATANAVLSDGNRTLYARSFDFWDRDTLNNWTRNDNALWKEFVGNARRHLARVVSEHLFETITTRHVLRPARNESYRGGRSEFAWDGRVKSRTPVFGWDFILLGGDEYDSTDIADNPVRFDLEVYDGSQLVYSAQDIIESRHQVAEPLVGCKKLSWSVRPVFEIDGKKRSGEWMRLASATERMMQQPGVTFAGNKREYWDGFAKITTGCKQ